MHTGATGSLPCRHATHTCYGVTPTQDHVVSDLNHRSSADAYIFYQTFFLTHRLGRGAAAEKADPAVCGVSQPPAPPPPPRVGPFGKRSRLPDPGDEDRKADSWRPWPCLRAECEWKLPGVAGGLSMPAPLPLPLPLPLRHDEREHDCGGGLSPHRFHSAFLRIFSYSLTAREIHFQTGGRRGEV